MGRDRTPKGHNPNCMCSAVCENYVPGSGGGDRRGSGRPRGERRKALTDAVTTVASAALTVTAAPPYVGPNYDGQYGGPGDYGRTQSSQTRDTTGGHVRAGTRAAGNRSRGSSQR